MTDLLVLDTSILAVGPFQITDTEIIASDIIFPKSVIPGYEIVSATLPPGFVPSDYQWIDDELVQKTPPYQPGPDNSAIVTESFNSSLRRKAVKLQEQGQTFEAVQLLLQAQGVQS